VVDVTPSLVAYFEVTIMKQAEGPSLALSKKNRQEKQCHACVAIDLSYQNLLFSRQDAWLEC